jgi:hypothetical protein
MVGAETTDRGSVIFWHFCRFRASAAGRISRSPVDLPIRLSFRSTSNALAARADDSIAPFRNWLDDLDSRELSVDSLVAATDRLSETIPADQCEFLRMKLFAHAPPVGLIIEDVPWADSTTTDFIVEILSTATQGRFFVLMSSQVPINDALLGSGRLAIEKLEGLPPGDAASLARALSAEKRLTSFQHTPIVDHADGVPLFIEEFARAVRDDDPTSDHIPITLRDSLMGFLESIGASRNMHFALPFSGAVSTTCISGSFLGLDDGELAPAVEALTKAQVLVQAGEMPGYYAGGCRV